MSDDLGKKIQQIAELLGQDSVPDNVKEMVALLASSMASKTGGSGDISIPSPADVQEQVDSADGEPVRNSGRAAPEAEMDPSAGNDMLNAARKALTKMNTASDPRINLLYAIKPFMNSRRQKKIGNCIQLLQVAGLSRLLNETDPQGRKERGD